MFNDHLRPTMGLEEEAFVVDQDTGRPASIPAACVIALKDALGPRCAMEYKASVLELITGVHHDPYHLIEDAAANRCEAGAVLSRFGLTLLNLPTHPTALAYSLPARGNNERYRRIEAYKGDAVRNLAVNGVHLHIGTYGDDNERIAAMRTLMHLVPVHIATTACSPLFNGRDTGQASWRIRVLRQLGPTVPILASDEQERRSLNFALRASGGPADASEHWGLIRSGAGKPTVEFRAADTVPNLDVLIGLVALSASAAYCLRCSSLQQPTIDLTTAVNIYEANIDAVAARGMAANLIDPWNVAAMPVAKYVARWIDICSPGIEALGFGDAIDELTRIMAETAPADLLRSVLHTARSEATIRGLSDEDATEFAAKRAIQWAWTTADSSPSNLVRFVPATAA